MKTVQLKDFGIENLSVAETADAQAAPGEVLIGAEAATINPPTWGW